MAKATTQSSASFMVRRTLPVTGRRRLIFNCGTGLLRRSGAPDGSSRFEAGTTRRLLFRLKLINERIKRPASILKQAFPDAMQFI
jgi:hypothetical protein